MLYTFLYNILAYYFSIVAANALTSAAISGFDARETVFVDDSPQNLEGAAKLGITPILIAANPASDVETSYRKIHSLSELL